ncbi:helix-turn-helix transcriptional regulator [Steroidobacter sp. S1-65]|uniref:Helix-turn-helix transcriptional regulator n=1 Tax=Steroidobacter gossypii TaxID=2805490 RepID=A0ABS1WTF7_9GAMM|nr:AraC family transcriptional regulator [Steroidobacter gossypii]MBM0104269.1 helix-turn-helix transcriptional regulator [Steroidobacter gossypii]
MRVDQMNRVRRVEPLASDWRHFSWQGGSFDMAQRALTPIVEGTIRVPEYLIFATLQGSAQRLEVRSDCGHRYSGADRAGMISLVPANCERRFRMQEVRSRWASLSIDPAIVASLLSGESAAVATGGGCISNVRDDFLFALLRELERTCAQDGCLDDVYCQTMAAAAGQHILRRYLRPSSCTHEKAHGLTKWQRRRVTDYVEARLHLQVRIADIAALLGYSEGYLHRAFRAACGSTPLEFINQRRIHRAVQILNDEPDIAVIDLALRVGFTSPNYFTRVFRKLVGVNPSMYRQR